MKKTRNRKVYKVFNRQRVRYFCDMCKQEFPTEELTIFKFQYKFRHVCKKDMAKLKAMFN